MDWFQYIRENIWLAILASSVLTSIFVSFANVVSEKAQNVDNTKLNIAFAVVFGLAVTDFNADWKLFTTWQDAMIRLPLTILLPYLVAKVKGQDIVDNLLSKVAEGAKSLTIGKKD